LALKGGDFGKKVGISAKWVRTEVPWLGPPKEATPGSEDKRAVSTRRPGSPPKALGCPLLTQPTARCVALKVQNEFVSIIPKLEPSMASKKVKINFKRRDYRVAKLR